MILLGVHAQYQLGKLDYLENVQLISFDISCSSEHVDNVMVHVAVDTLIML